MRALLKRSLVYTLPLILFKIHICIRWLLEVVHSICVSPSRRRYTLDLIIGHLSRSIRLDLINVTNILTRNNLRAGMSRDFFTQTPTQSKKSDPKPKKQTQPKKTRLQTSNRKTRTRSDLRLASHRLSTGRSKWPTIQPYPTWTQSDVWTGLIHNNVDRY